MLHPTHCPFTERQDSLLGFGAVGVIYHHSPSKASSHGLGRDELQLEKEEHANVIHPQAKPKRLLGSVTANCVCTRQVNPAFIKPYTKPLALQFCPGSSLQYFFVLPALPPCLDSVEQQTLQERYTRLDFPALGNHSTVLTSTAQSSNPVTQAKI